jgi:hypothetical protein
VRGGFERVAQGQRRRRVIRAELGDSGFERLLHAFVGDPQLRIPGLVQARPVDDVEQRPMLRREPDVSPGHRGQPLLG